MMPGLTNQDSVFSPLVQRGAAFVPLLSRPVDGLAARGQKLTREERKAMREQLIDVAKVIPALAIFAAPGGILLLIALAKVLPFNILPSAFQDDPAQDEPPDIGKAS